MMRFPPNAVRIASVRSDDRSFPVAASRAMKSMLIGAVISVMIGVVPGGPSGIAHAVTGEAQAAAATPAASVVNVPHPQYDQLKPLVRSQLETARGQFDRTLSSPSAGREHGVAYGRLGMHYQAHQQQAAARACYVNAALLDAQNFRWPYLLAVYHEEAGELLEASEQYLQSVRLNPDSVAGAVRLARVLIQLERLDGAQSLLDQVLAAEPKHAAALAALGDIAAARDEHSKAVEYYNAALAIQPEASQLTYRVGISYRALGQLEQARTALEQRGERIPSIADPLLAFVQGHKLGSSFFVSEGDKAMRGGDVETAARLFDAAAAINPEDPRALLGLGQSLGAVGKLDSAIARFDQVLQIQPYNTNAHYFKGALHEIDGDDDQALRHFRSAVSEENAHFEATFMLANALLRKRLFDEAAVQYGRIAKARQDPEFLYQEGVAWLAGQRCGAAQNALMAAVTVKPSDQRYIQAVSRLFSVCETGPTQKATALEYAQRLYDAHPGLETSVSLAMAMAANGRFEDAIDFQTQAIFEALKANMAGMPEILAADLDRYREGKPAELAWPHEHSIYQPARLTLDRL